MYVLWDPIASHSSQAYVCCSGQYEPMLMCHSNRRKEYHLPHYQGKHFQHRQRSVCARH